MGIYLFERDVLVALLEKTDSLDFGKEIFPTSIRTHRVQAHLFDGYWEDIGTIRSFYEANLALARPDPPFSFNAEQQPIYSRARFLPPSRLDGAAVNGSLIADGCIIEAGAEIANSVIGLRCRIGRGAKIRDSIVMGADWYQTDEQLAADREASRPNVGIGAGAVVSGAIVDKNCRIGRDVHIALPADADDRDADGYAIRDGIVVVPRDAALADGWRLE